MEPPEFVNILKELHKDRRELINALKEVHQDDKRRSLTDNQRDEVLSKTGNRCHVCGGDIEDSENWQVDHVSAYSTGGSSDPDNYLPAHAVCNNYRWHYAPDEIQWILKLGVFTRTLIEKEDGAVTKLTEKFLNKENRLSRRKK